MLVQEGDRVEQGQLVAALRKDRLEAAASAMEAQAGAQAEVVARLKAGSRPEEIRRARAEYDAAQADANNATITYRRMQSLVHEDATAVQNADDARARAEMASARLRSAKETLDLAIAGPRKEDIAAAEATLEAYRAQLALARQELADANLYAPSTGILQNRILEPGDMASPATPVYTLALTDPLWVRAYVPETDLGKIHQGMTAKVTTDSYPGKTYDGWIGFISPTAQFTPKSVETPDLRSRLVYQIRVYVHNPNNELRLGMPATVTIPLTIDGTTEP
jgi:HlyD family secretion protein